LRLFSDLYGHRAHGHKGMNFITAKFMSPISIIIPRCSISE
jgi:hypothetical protein